MLTVRQLVVLLLFNFLFFFGSAQKKMQISVSSWIIEPNQADFEKPLIFVDFWATWCGPCISSMPHTESLMNDFNDDILFLYISNEPSGKVRKFMNKRNKTFFSAVDTTGNNIDNFNIKTLPNSILMDYQGKIIWKGKPNEMDKRLLKRFVNLYNYEIGEIDRIRIIKSNNKKIVWNYFYSNTNEIKYLEVDNIANEFSIEDNTFYLSGDVNFLASIAYEVSSSQIVSQIKTNKKYTLKGKFDSINGYRNIIKTFLVEKCNVNISKRRIKEKVYILEKTTDENFFNINMYNFEKGNNKYLVDDLTVIIDNATIEEMAITLSEFSDHRFQFEGECEKRYDWNIHYKFNSLTIDQLKNELNFKITEKEIEVERYFLK